MDSNCAIRNLKICGFVPKKYRLLCMKYAYEENSNFIIQGYEIDS